MSTEALIIGAGPAGLAASQAPHARGHRAPGARARRPAGLHLGKPVRRSRAAHGAAAVLVARLGSHRTLRPFPTRLDMLAIPPPLRGEVRGAATLRRQRRVPDPRGRHLASRVGLRRIASCSLRHHRHRHRREPFVPDLPQRAQFRGEGIHSSSYRRPDRYAGLRVVVAGTGNSASDIAVELARAGADGHDRGAIGATVVPLQIAGVPIHYLAVGVSALPKPVQAPILTAFASLTSLVRRTPVLPPAPKTPCRNVPRDWL